MGRIEVALSLVVCALATGGCQHGIRPIDSSLRLTPIEDADAVLLETDRRYVVLELVESPVEDIVDDDAVVGYVSFPWYAGNGVRFEGTRFGLGWLGGSMRFSEMFTDKSARPLGIALPEDRTRDLDSEIELEQLLERSRERERAYDPAVLGQIGAGGEVRILGPFVPGWGSTPEPAAPDTLPSQD